MQWLATFATLFGNMIITDYGYYDNFTFFRFSFEFERFLGRYATFLGGPRWALLLYGYEIKVMWLRSWICFEF